MRYFRHAVWALAFFMGTPVATWAKPSDLVTIQATSSFSEVCSAGSRRVFDRLVLQQGGTVVPFTIPPGKVLVVTALDWTLIQGPNATSRTRTGLLFAESGGGVNGPAALSSAAADAAGRAGATQVFPTGLVIKTPGRLCFDMLQPAPGDDFIAVLHGFLAPDE